MARLAGCGAHRARCLGGTPISEACGPRPAPALSVNLDQAHGTIRRRLASFPVCASLTVCAVVTGTTHADMLSVHEHAAQTHGGFPWPRGELGQTGEPVGVDGSGGGCSRSLWGEAPRHRGVGARCRTAALGRALIPLPPLSPPPCSPAPYNAEALSSAAGPPAGDPGRVVISCSMNIEKYGQS